MARVSRKNKIALEENVQPIEKTYSTGIYIRLSNEDQLTHGRHKLDNQEQVIRDYMKGRPEFRVSKVYSDNGCTGTNFQRGAFEEMMNDIKEQKINCIVAKDLSRLGRNHIEVEQYLQVIFPFLKVRFIAVNDNFDTLETSSDITVSLKNIVNAAYAKDISKKVYSSKQALREKGLFTGNIPSYGYERSKDDSHKLVVNKVTSQVVREIFALKMQRKTYSEIAKLMNERKILSPMAYWYQRGMVHHEKFAQGKWLAATVKSILRNQMYVGDMVQGKKNQCLAEGITKSRIVRQEDYIVVKNTHEAIIDREMFESIQAICDKELVENQKKRLRNDGLIVPESILDNLIFSADGQKMYRTRNVYADQKVTFGYITTSHRNVDSRNYCSYYISEANVFKVLKRAIYTQIKMLFNLEDFLRQDSLKKSIAVEQHDQEVEVIRLKKDIAKYTEYLAGLYKDMVEGIITYSEYEELKCGYQKKKEQVIAQLDRTMKDGKIITTFTNHHQKYKQQYKRFLRDEELTKELIRAMVSKITVIEKKKIQITFLFEDEVKIFINAHGGEVR